MAFPSLLDRHYNGPMAEADLRELYAKGLAQQRAGQAKAALQIYGLVLRRGGGAGGAEILVRCGECYEAVGDFARADEAYGNAIARDPDLDLARRRAAALALRARELALKVGQTATAEELRRGAVRYLAGLGERLLARGAFAEAEAAFRDAARDRARGSGRARRSWPLPLRAGTLRRRGKGDSRGHRARALSGDGIFPPRHAHGTPRSAGRGRRSIPQRARARARDSNRPRSRSPGSPPLRKRPQAAVVGAAAQVLVRVVVGASRRELARRERQNGGQQRGGDGPPQDKL